MVNNLIVFDIDGTLIHYIDYEEIAYLKSVKAITGIDNINTQWDSYQYSTDSGILTEIFLQHLNREPTAPELKAIKEAYVGELAQIFISNVSAVQCIPGAEVVFKQLQQTNWDVAIATGGWSASAALKLNTAQVPYDEIPSAHAEDHVERAQIISQAISRAQCYYNKKSYHNIVYAGDRLWDYKATQALNIHFIGVGGHLKNLNSEEFFKVDHFNCTSFIRHLKYLESCDLDTLKNQELIEGS